jgi:HPt (histidine-containing phosphotransfer) domain-containing protein
MRRLVALFLETTPPLLRDLGQALAAGDADALLRAAHAQGLVLAIGDDQGTELARRLEVLAHEGALEKAKGVLAELDSRFAGLQSELRQMEAQPIRDQREQPVEK